MMRLVGAAFLFAAFFFAGVLAGKNERARTAECEAFLELFRYVKNQVGYFRAPTKEIYHSYHSPILAEIGFLSALAEREEDAIYYDAWQKALGACRKKLHLSASQIEIVQAFGASVGKSNKELQTKNLDYYIDMMTSETEKQRTEMQKNIKLYRTIGFTVGAAVAILVI